MDLPGRGQVLGPAPQGLPDKLNVDSISGFLKNLSRSLLPRSSPLLLQSTQGKIDIG